MTDPLNELKSKWESAKNTAPDQSIDPKTVIVQSEKKLRSVVGMHRGNIAILLLTLIGISCFFIFVAPLAETLSRVGIFLMVGGLLLRILIEGYSIHRSSKIDMSDTAKVTNEKSLSFYTYRKRIHGPVTVGILIAYTVGFYVLTPEFADYFTTNQLILIDVSYIGAAAIFLYSIRKAIKKEMEFLEEMKELQAQLVEK